MSKIHPAARRFLLSLSILVLSVSVANAAETPMAKWWCYNDWCCKWLDLNGQVGGVEYDVFVQESCMECPGTTDGWQPGAGERPGACY
jgi:hypothetical protein